MQATLFLFLRLALLITLGIIIGAIVVALWREWRGRATSLLAESHPTLVLFQPSDGHSLQFRNLVIIIGRGQGCDAVIPDPTLSGKHARFSYHHQQWWLEDLHTTNGTFLNGQMITTPVVITNGDAIMCGRVHMEVQIEEAA